MPSNFVKKVAREKGISKDTAESKWKRAKAQAAKQGHAKNWRYVTAIFKSMSGIKKESVLPETFEQYFTEANTNRSVPVYFTFGKFNLPTKGHMLVFNTMAAQSGLKFVFPSNSVNPLPFSSKVIILQKLLNPLDLQVVGEHTITNVFKAVEYLYKQGYRNLTFVGGSDRVGEGDENLADKILKYYNGNPKFKNIKISKMQAGGMRNPKARGVAGVSSTKLRNFIRRGQEANFKMNIPSEIADELWNAAVKYKHLLKKEESK